MSKNHKHDMASVLDALDNSDGDVDHPQEILVELQELEELADQVMF